MNVSYKNKDNISIAYTFGVASVCKEIKKSNTVYDLSIKGNLVTIVSDESAVLGLEDIDQKAALPVMEGKAKKEGVACYDTGNINYKSLGINI